MYRIDFIEGVDEAYIRLYWNSSTLGSKQIVNSSHIYYREYVTGTPVDVENTCPTYYDGDNPDHSNTCWEICGDGFIIGNEVCDDQNANSGDGWDSTCRTVEAPDWIWFHEDSQVYSTCTQWYYLYYRNSAKDQCFKYSSSSKIDQKLNYLYIVTFVSIGMNLIYSIVTFTSVHGCFTAINLIQTMTLFIILEASFPYDIINFIEGLSVFLFNWELGSISYPKCDYKRKVNLWYSMEVIGYKSRSGIANIFYPIIIFGCILFLHYIVLIIYRINSK